MHIEVDQSGKIEQMSWDTVLAFSDHIHRAILISAKVKRTCQRELRARGVKPGMITARMFAVGVFLLLEDHHLRLIRQRVPDFPGEAISFEQVGKGALAHSLAWLTRRGKRRPDKLVTVEELLRFC
ncbi:MAG: hypothetical protein WBW48_18870 [Anaerolineae bacterium]